MIATLPGDLLLCHNPSLLGRAIRWAERSRGEAKSWANHVAGISSPGMVLEALWKVKEHPLSDLDPAQYQIWRHTGLSDDEREAVAAAALGYKGRSYGPLKLGLHLGDALLSKVAGGSPYFFRRLARMDDYPICSWVWACAYDKALGYQFGCDPEAASPDDMHDFVRSNPNDWSMIHAPA